MSIFIRLIILKFFPIDWNWDSYHHWQISYLSLKIGFPNFRFWDLNGCEYYWGLLPHFIQALLMNLFSSSNIFLYRALNIFLGSLNPVLIYLISKKNFPSDIGLFSGLFFCILPTSVIFDVLALQDTLALFLILYAVLLINKKPFFSGVLFSLAGQSRTEYILISLIVIIVILISENFKTNVIPLFLGWFVITFIFSYFLWTQTGNPLYPIYWNLYNIFGGWEKSNNGKSFIDLFIIWIHQKLLLWLRKITGITILVSCSMTIIFFFNSIKKRPKNYKLILCFFVTTSFLLPTFLTYYGSNFRSFIIMLRMVNPIIAFGLLSVPTLLQKYYNFNEIKKIFIIFMPLLLISHLYFIPLYSGFQIETIKAFDAADKVHEYFIGGKLVCDYPTINYKLIQLGISYSFLIGSHYAPQYYGSYDPFEFIKWLAENKITLWVYNFNNEQLAYSILNQNYPNIFIKVWENDVAKIFIIDPFVMENILNIF